MMAQPAGIKIVFAGPSRSHKSAIASFLAGQTDSLEYNCGPTVGCRIVEADRAGTPIEIWDVAGDQSYENTWPAAQKDINGVFLIFNADVPGHAKEVELWFEWFVQRTGLPSSCCTCVGLTQQGGNVALPAIEAVTDVVPLQDGLEVLRKSFDKLVMRVLKNRQ